MNNNNFKVYDKVKITVEMRHGEGEDDWTSAEFTGEIWSTKMVNGIKMYNVSLDKGQQFRDGTTYGLIYGSHLEKI